jgi:RNA polymerase sigma-70 factor, ECF subfamily
MVSKMTERGESLQTRQVTRSKGGQVVDMDAHFERRLVRRLKRGDEQALKIIMDKYHDRLRAVSSGICDNPEDVEEVLQDVFLTLLSKGDRFEGRSSLFTWLYRITVNHSLMKIRKHRTARHHSILDPFLSLLGIDNHDSSGERKNPEELLLAKETRKRVLSAMNGLPEHYRTVFQLRDIWGLTTREASESLNITNTSVKSRLHRCRAHISRNLASAIR